MSVSDGMTTAQAVRSMLLLMPRLVGRAKRLPIPAALRGLDLPPGASPCWPTCSTKVRWR
jgi:hypothetical protein